MDPEYAAQKSLKRIATAQSIFREGDKDGNGDLDYGSLAQLGQAQLIDEVLASGTRNGYLFAARASTSTSEFLWWATATPQAPDARQRWYFMNEMGQLYAAPAPLPFDRESCLPPAGATTTIK